MAETAVTGVEQVLEVLDGIVDQEKLRRALANSCALVERSAKRKAPKDIGELRRSVTSRIEDTQGIVFTPLEYAPYVEFGTGLFAEEGGRQDVPWHYQDDEGEWHTTSGQSPQPYMRPALDENREQIIRLLRGALIEK